MLGGLLSQKKILPLGDKGDYVDILIYSSNSKVPTLNTKQSLA